MWFVLWSAVAVAQEGGDGGTAAPPPSRASGPTATFNDDFELRYYRLADRLPDPSDVAVFNYVEQVNRLNGHLGAGAWSLDFQVDEVALFANQYYLNDQLYVERELIDEMAFNPWPDFSYATLEKIRLQRESSTSTLTFGDAYAAFGRGIALNLNRNVDIDIDTSIQGFKGVFRLGSWDATAVVGQLNRQQVFQDNVNLLLDGDRRHALGGVRVERFGLGPANLGAHAVAYEFVSDPGLGTLDQLESPVDSVVGGATAELFGVGGVDWFFEGDLFGYAGDALAPSVVGSTDPGAEVPEGAERTPCPTSFREVCWARQGPGYALYGSSAFYPGRTSWLIEVKRYVDTELANRLLTQELYETAVAPTLEYERAITEDSSAAVNSNDIFGGRTRVDFAVVPGQFVPYLSVAAFRDAELGGLHFNRSPETIVHGLAGLELIRDEGAALINAGYRRDIRQVAAHGADQQLHGDAAIKFPIPAGLHAEVQVAVERFSWGQNEFQQNDYVEVESGLTVQRGSALAVTWYTDLTSNPLINSVGNLSDDLYGALELQVKPTSAVTLKAFYGAYKAGIRCSGGQCRQLPGFDGARFSFVGAF